MLVALLLLCLSVSAQTEYSGIAGASPGLVRANKQAAAKQANRSSKARYTSTASKPKTSNDGNTNSYNSTYESGETEVRDGFKTFSRGMGKVIKRETKTMGEVTRKIGADGKKFFQKLGKGISDSFKSDTTTSK